MGYLSPEKFVAVRWGGVINAVPGGCPRLAWGGRGAAAAAKGPAASSRAPAAQLPPGLLSAPRSGRLYPGACPQPGRALGPCVLWGTPWKSSLCGGKQRRGSGCAGSRPPRATRASPPRGPPQQGDGARGQSWGGLLSLPLSPSPSLSFFSVASCSARSEVKGSEHFS